jgi:glycine dehydrogenase
MIDDNSKEFIYRHIGPNKDEQTKMLNAVGYKSLDDLMKNTVPEKILLKDDLKIDTPLSENDALKKLKSISKKNKIFRNFIGMGYYNSLTPNVILRNILENPGWYTSYTPYQPEVAQGRLEMLLNFQQLIIDLTGMDIANASLLDESTAAAEAVGLSQRLDKNNSNKIFISNSCNPQTIDLIKTRTEPFGLELFIGNEKEYLSNINDNLICGVLSYPGTLGEINDPSETISQIHKKKGKAIVISDLLSLTRLKTPAELGADIAVGSAQRFGIPMGYGGPHAAFFATKEELSGSQLIDIEKKLTVYHFKLENNI